MGTVFVEFRSLYLYSPWWGSHHLKNILLEAGSSNISTESSLNFLHNDELFFETLLTVLPTFENCINDFNNY